MTIKGRQTLFTKIFLQCTRANMFLNLDDNDILNLPNPDQRIKAQVLTQELEIAGTELPRAARNFLLSYPFKTVREMVEKLVLYSSLPADQATEDLFEDIFNPHRSNVIVPKFLHKVSCGFISPAEGYKEGYLSLNDKFVKNPASTFIVQADGDCMKDTIYCGDILLVDYSLQARANDIILAVLEGEFTVKRLTFEGKKVLLRPDNPLYNDILIDENMDFTIRGVIISVHRDLRA